jgi:hypothetical protein
LKEIILQYPSHDFPESEREDTNERKKQKRKGGKIKYDEVRKVKGSERSISEETHVQRYTSGAFARI